MRAARWIALLTLVMAAYAQSSAADLPQRILLIPLDDRPAASHFAQMIGQMGATEVVLPPEHWLGHFTQPGYPEMLLSWMESTDISKFDAVVVSMDMIAYGGLIASRVPRSSYNLAIQRIRRFWAIRKTAPNTRFYGFSAIMRLHPTATKASAAWRIQLGQYAMVKERYRLSGSDYDRHSLNALKAKIPPQEIQRYETTRDRDHRVQQELVRMVGFGVFDYLILGQDDAQPIGPHVRETVRLKEMVANLDIGDSVYFCEGIDQHSNVLVSRALLRHAGWTPKVRVVWADPLGKEQIALYESERIELSLLDQIKASGALPAGESEAYDYSLYVNTPEPRPGMFNSFLASFELELDQGFPVAVADINLGKTGTGDPRLYEAILEREGMGNLLAYAGWNTAGNTMGTTIPAANVYLLARRERIDPLAIELARRKFLLHRLVNDFEYHQFVRPEAYALIDALPTASREETYGEAFQQIDNLVREQMSRRLYDRFQQQMLGKRFYAGTTQYVVTGLEDVSIYLPWPRAYEVRMEFKVAAREVAD